MNSILVGAGFPPSPGYGGPAIALRAEAGSRPERKRLLIVATLTCAAIVAAGCDTVPLLAPTASTITVSAATLVLPVGGSTEIQAFVLEQSKTAVHNGTAVRFTTTLGTLNPVEAQTRNGMATTTFTSNASGVAMVNAISGGATAGAAIEIRVGTAAVAPGSVTVRASASTVPPTGGTVTITASALDTTGNRMVGIPISFSTTAGTLSAGSATTDESGEARVQLTTNAQATVTARVGAESGTVSVTVATATSLTLATSTPVVAGQPMTLTITPAAGTAPRVAVNWGDGNTEDLGVVAAARGVTHTYANPGVYSINVTATGQGGDTFSTATTVTVGARPGPTVTVTPRRHAATSPFVFTVTPAPEHRHTERAHRFW